MTQTTGAISGRALYVAVSTTGTTWTDISGQANGVEVSGGERSSGEAFTADTDTPIVTIGKRSMLEVKVTSLYTEVTTEAYTLMKSAYEAGSNLYVKWAPKGNTSGNILYTTDAGFALSPPYQGVADVGDGEALATQITLTVPKITQSTA